MKPGVNIAKYTCMIGTQLFGNDTRYCYTTATVDDLPILLPLWTGIEPICRGMYVIV